MTAESTGCDKCGSIPDGDRTDTILFLRCGHAICN